MKADAELTDRERSIVASIRCCLEELVRSGAMMEAEARIVQGLLDRDVRVERLEEVWES